MTDTFQWERCAGDAGGSSCADIPGATASTYTLVADDVGHTIRVRADRDGSPVGESAATAVITNTPPAPPSPPAGELFAGPLYTPLASSPRVELGYGQGALTKLTSFGIGSFYQAAVFDSRSQGWATRQAVNQDGWKMDDVPLPAQADEYIAAMGATDPERHILVVGDDRMWNIYGTGTIDGALWHCRSLGEPRAPGVSHGVWDNPAGPFIGRASGFCSAAGIIRKAEFDAGEILHALVGAVGSINHANSAREPATYSDGTGGAYNPASNLQMGSLLQLDPLLDDADFAAMGFAAKWYPVCRALQSYGLYTGDSTSNGSLKVYCERWNNAGSVAIDDGSWAPHAMKLIPHLRLIHPDSVPAKAPALVLDDRTVFGEPHE